jgi:hypothetical protein
MGFGDGRGTLRALLGKGGETLEAFVRAQL